MFCVAIASLRGGTGKSTLAVNLAAALADRGDTLLIDLDRKSDCAMGLAVPHEAIRRGSHSILDGDADRRHLRREALAWPVQKHLDLVPAKPARGLNGTSRASDTDAGDARIRSWLARCGRRYDHVLLDVPTENEHTLRAALEVADLVLMPAIPDFAALAAVQREIQLLRNIIRSMGKETPVRVVGNMHDVRSRFSREMVLGFRQRLGDNYFDTVVHTSVKIREAASFGQPIRVYDRKCPAADDFGALAEEVAALAAADTKPTPASLNPRLKLVDVPSGHVAIPIHGDSRRRLTMSLARLHAESDDDEQPDPDSERFEPAHTLQLVGQTDE